MITPQLREAAKLIAIATARANPPPYFAEPVEAIAWVVEAIAIGMCAGVESGVERATLAATTKSLIKYGELGQKIVKLETERDEARAEIERLAKRLATECDAAVVDRNNALGGRCLGTVLGTTIACGSNADDFCSIACRRRRSISRAIEALERGIDSAYVIRVLQGRV